MSRLYIAAIAWMCTAVCACTSNAPPVPARSSAQQEPLQLALARFEADANGGVAASTLDPLLAHLNRGELLRLDGRYAQSTASYVLADLQLRAHEDDNVGAAENNAHPGAYRPSDFEKLMLTNRLALNYVADGQWDLGLANLNRTHAREALIASGTATSGKPRASRLEGGNYPFETLNDSAVLGLTNGYQTALSHYLAGFLLEARGDPLLAAPAYRQAMELQPQVEVLQRGFMGLPERARFRDAKTRSDLTDVLFVVESGWLPEREARTLSLLATTANGSVKVSLSYPAILSSTNSASAIRQLRIGDGSGPVQEIVNFNTLSRRALRDEMPNAVSKALGLAVAKSEERESRKRSLATGGSGVTLVATTSASTTDSRAWRSLPERVYFLRSQLPQGAHVIGLDDDTNNFTINLRGPFAVVQLRKYLGRCFFGGISYPLPAMSTSDQRNSVASFQNPPPSTAGSNEYIAVGPPAVALPVGQKNVVVTASRNVRQKAPPPT